MIKGVVYTPVTGLKIFCISSSSVKPVKFTLLLGPKKLPAPISVRPNDWKVLDIVKGAILSALTK